MTYQEALQKEKRWYKRAIIINLFHNSMLLKKKKWTMRATAKRLGISLGMVSESILLAKALVGVMNIEDLTREDALKIVRSEK